MHERDVARCDERGMLCVFVLFTILFVTTNLNLKNLDLNKVQNFIRSAKRNYYLSSVILIMKIGIICGI